MVSLLEMVTGANAAPACLGVRKGRKPYRVALFSIRSGAVCNVPFLMTRGAKPPDIKRLVVIIMVAVDAPTGTALLARARLA